jgi:hypothetical protein
MQPWKIIHATLLIFVYQEFRLQLAGWEACIIHHYHDQVRFMLKIRISGYQAAVLCRKTTTQDDFQPSIYLSFVS